MEVQQEEMRLKSHTMTEKISRIYTIGTYRYGHFTSATAQKPLTESLPSAQPTRMHIHFNNSPCSLTGCLSTAAWHLRGVEVCGETTMVMKSTHAQQFEWKGFGLKLHVNEGSLPADVEQ